jgi:myo-inositol-1-phosphate synthase
MLGGQGANAGQLVAGLEFAGINMEMDLVNDLLKNRGGGIAVENKFHGGSFCITGMIQKGASGFNDRERL